MKRRGSLYAQIGYSGRAAYDRDRKRPAAGRSRGVVPLDTGKIRKKALENHRKAERELAKLTDQLKRYHEHDVPGFRAWCSKTFGSLLTQLRELGVAYQEKQALASELSAIAYQDNLSETAAYRELMWRRANPEAAEAKQRLREEAENRRREAEEKKRRARGEPEIDLDADPYEAIFGAEEDEDGEFPEEDGDFAEFIESFLGGSRSRAPRKSKPEGKTVKELYRAIVRRLHPDHHGHMTEARKHLWNEAQKAYRARDEETLRTVLAQCETGEAGLSANTPVSVILSLIRRLKAALRPVRGQIRQVNRKPEWNYESKIGDPSYVRNVEAIIRDDLRHLKRQHDELARLLNDIAKKAAFPSRKHGRTPNAGPSLPGFDFTDSPRF